MFLLLLALVILLLLYLLIAVIFPHLKEVNLSDETKKKITHTNFTKETTGRDRASIIYEGKDALNLRMSLVQNSKSSLDIVMYKIVDSESTRAFFGEVYRAAERGVEVNLLVNGVTYIAYQNRPSFRALNAHPYITCRIYNPVKISKPQNLQFLMHDKIILADNQYVITGGRNVDERHFQPNGYEKAVAHDLEVFVVKTKNSNQNSVIYEVKDYIDRLYNSNWTVIDKEKENPTLVEDLLKASVYYKKTNPQFYKKSLNDFINDTVATNNITLIHNPISPVKKEPTLGAQLNFLANKADESVVIQTPYITGNNEITQKLKKMTNQTKVSILTNSLASSPNPFAYPNYYGHRRKFLQTGIDLFEFQSEDSLHNKSWMFDERLLAIGTFNLDARSLFINTEVMLVIDSVELTAKFTKHLEKIKEQSLQVGRNNKYIVDKELKELKVPFIKKVLAWGSFNFFRGIQFLL